MSQKTDSRTALLKAGEKLAVYLDLAQLTPEALAAEADVEAGVFTTEFGSLDAYLTALQLKFMTELRDIVVQAATAQTGVARLRDGGAAYLDQCLRQHALRRWFVKARSQPGAVVEGLNKQDQAYILVLGLEFKALKWSEPQAMARRFLTQLQQVANDEHAAGHVLPGAREQLWSLLQDQQQAAAA